MDKKIKKVPVNYVDNKKFYEDIVQYKLASKIAVESDKPKPKIPNYSGFCINAIATKMTTMKNNRGEPAFMGYTFVDEMVSDGIENCILYFDNFDPDKYDKPFAYFSKIIYYAFLRRIAKEKKQLYLKYKSALNYGIFNAVTSPDSESDSSSFEMFDNLVDFVSIYEEKQKVKSQKTQQAKIGKK